jgi:micrococcal nuclease
MRRARSRRWRRARPALGRARERHGFAAILQRRARDAAQRHTVSAFMSARRLTVVVLALAAAVAAGASGLLEGGAGEPPPGTGDARGDVGRVVGVVDGDTIHVRLGGRRETVRYIGVDTPETRHPTKGVQCFGQRASEFNEQLVGGELVRLVRDVEERDRYGRLLAYVVRERDGLFVNAELARLGYARPLTIAPDVRYADRFARLAREAREARRGLWSAC